MEFVVTWQHADFFALGEVFGTDGAAEVSFRVGTVGVVSRDDDWRCWTVGIALCCAEAVCTGAGNHGGVCVGRCWWSGSGSSVHFYVGGLFLGEVLVVAELDNGKGLEHGAGNALCATLPASSDDVAGPVAFGVSMCTDGAGYNDHNEEGGDDTRDRV
jgi:hypothetical protein